MGLFSKKKPEVVDIRAAAPRQKKLEFGMPTRCPSCGEPGYLDSIDLSRQLMFQHCPACFTKWETTEADLAEMNG
jgi:uncharacterized protein (DUF983 family)